MSKVGLPENRDVIAGYINNIIKSSQRIIEEEQSLFDFLDEALREAEEDIADSDAENSYSNTDLNAGKSTSMEKMEGVVGETVGDVVSHIPLVNGVDDSIDVNEEMSPPPTTETESQETTEDVHVLTTDKDDTSSHDDSVVDSKKEIEKYVQEIIKEAQEKVDKDEADMNGTQSPEVHTKAEVADGKETGTENNNAPATVIADKETKEATEIENGNKSASHPANNEESRNTEENKDMEIEEDSLLNQKHFIEVNSKDTGRKKRSGGRFHRIRKSMSNLFSCTSSNTKEVT